MSYKNVGSPVFYVDYLLWLKTLGLPYIWDTSLVGFDNATLSETISLNPAKQTTLYTDGIGSGEYMELIAPPAIPHPTISGQNTRYFAVLGHNYHSASSAINVSQTGGIDVVNTGPQYDGFSIMTNYQELHYEDAGNPAIPYGVYRVSYGDATNNLKVGCYSVGNFYQMRSPDLNLSMEIEYGGVSTIETKGGASLSNSYYSKPPAWGGGLGAWELGGVDSAGHGIPGSERAKLQKSGRRTWSLSWSFLSDSFLFPETSALSNLGNDDFTYAGDAPTASEAFNQTLLTDNNFYSQVIHKTNGGQLPFIFQPDSSNNSSDQFCIARIVGNSIKFTQTSVNTYSIKLKIRESW